MDLLYNISVKENNKIDTSRKKFFTTAKKYNSNDAMEWLNRKNTRVLSRLKHLLIEDRNRDEENEEGEKSN